MPILLSLIVLISQPHTLKMSDGKSIIVYSWKQTRKTIEFTDSSGEFYSVPTKWVVIEKRISKHQTMKKKRVAKRSLGEEMAPPEPDHPIVITTERVKKYSQVFGKRNMTSSSIEVENGECESNAFEVLKKQKKKNTVFSRKLKKEVSIINALKQKKKELTHTLFLVREYNERRELKSELAHLKDELHLQQEKIQHLTQEAVKAGVKIR